MESRTYFAIVQPVERVAMLALEIRIDPGSGMNPDAVSHALGSVSVKVLAAVASD